VGQDQDGFSILVRIQSQHSIGAWKLSFVIPGAADVFVVPDGIRWQQSGTNGGTASNYVASTESAGSAVIGGHESGGMSASRSGEIVQFTVRGSGVPRGLAHCRYDGAACQFKPLPTQAATQRPGPG